MPNWAMGNVIVIGTAAGVKSFAERFICGSEEPKTVPGKKFFARSFLCDRRSDVFKDIEEEFHNAPETEEKAVHFGVDFAWSVHSCIIEGYPEQFKDECLTLSEACMEDCVCVEIEASEPGMCFEEHLTCDADGDLNYEDRDMLRYKCLDCGDISSYPSFEAPEDRECCECGGQNLVLAGEEDQ